MDTPTKTEVEERMAKKGLYWVTNVSNPKGYRDEIQPRTFLEGGLFVDAINMIAVLRKEGRVVEVDYAFYTDGNFLQTNAAIYASKK